VILDDKPPLDEALLEHHGIKGMRWGVRRKSTSGDHSNFKRNAKRVGVGVLAVGGVAAAAYVLSKHGGSSVSSIPKFTATHKHGEEAVKAFDEHIWKRQLDTIMLGTQLQAKARINARNSVRQPFS
jgi:hypothetical protein